MILRTRHKIALAKVLRFPIVSISRALRKGTVQTVTRGGIVWSLDLDEGIDLAVYIFGAFEPTTSRVLEELISPGDVVMDIGANIGAHTLPLAKRVGSNGRVFAFEPTRFAHAKLERNLELNPELAIRVTVKQMFLTDRAAASVPEAVYSSWPLSRSNNRHEKHGGVAKDTSGATAMRLDEYVVEHAIGQVRLIKLDVDGHECGVLRGARNILRTHRPVIVMELAPYVLEEAGESVEELVAILSEAGYMLHEESSQALLPMEADRLGAMVVDGGSMNVIAKPAAAKLSGNRSN
jgi:FkbM family methyltransferase